MMHKLGFQIEIWVNKGYTIGDNLCTIDRIDVYLADTTKGEGWHKAIQALKTIEKN